MRPAATSPFSGRFLLLWIAFVVATAAPSQAGTVILLSKPKELQGPLTLSPTGIQVQGAPAEIPLADILEANFSDALQVNYFSSIGDVSTALPTDWKGQDLVTPTVPGSAAYANGELALTGPQMNPTGVVDPKTPSFVFGLPWRGDGQWTFRIKSADAIAGFLLADKIPMSAEIGISTWGPKKNLIFLSDTRVHHRNDRFATPAATPIWYCVTRQGNSFNFESSTDGVAWNFCVQKLIDLPTDFQVLFFTNRSTGNNGGTAVFDQMTFTPTPGQSSAPGVLLRSGSFVTGSFRTLDLTKPALPGKFVHGTQVIPIATDQIAQVVFHSDALGQPKETGTQVGIIMKNGDFNEGTFGKIAGTSASLNSVIMGIRTYKAQEMGACVLQSVKPIPADYEIRLKDGSALFAKGFETKNGNLVIDEISGLQIPVTPNDIAQIRAGSSRAQSLALLDWKPTSAPDANAPIQGSLAPAIYWTGGNQERILAMAPGAKVDFPLANQYHTLSFGLALPPDSPANVEVTLRVLADGKELLKTFPVHGGEAPRVTEVTLPANKTLTLIAESTSPNARVLVVDPTVLRKDSL